MPAKKTEAKTKTTARSRMLDQAAEKVRERLGLETLATRSSDRLDFHTLSVASIRQAVQIAFEVGYVAGGGRPAEQPTEQPTDPCEILNTLEITKIDRRDASGGGLWVSGRIAGHRFEALVFPEHAESEAYELDKSRISKLWLKDNATGQMVANFERGWDLTPATDTASKIVDLLAAGLAETVFGK
jgi:hypothetical protein